MDQLAITPPLKRRSARHSNQENQKQLREKIIQVATTIYKRDGIEALTMRSVAKQVGMSAMGLYYYFNDKSELLVALWDSILDDLHIQVARAIDGAGSARERLRLSIDANLSYWEAHPENFRLVYMSEQTVRGEHSQKLTMSCSYQNVISIALPLIEQVAIEINGDLRQAPLARDLRLSLMVGFLHSALINVRYPWIDLAKLRAHAIESIAIAVEHCLAQNLHE
ncbi:TetR/AcrR family transcriptional regulator [Undibacterium danionis]|uniref:TetR/AcrR family transcriptional regulator n=1 Tax=Undibacterium danionis TaxID=1812100 RepID=A0ABV6I8Z7_9BURK